MSDDGINLNDQPPFPEPPAPGAEFDGVEWQDWFYRLYDLVGQNGVSTAKVTFLGHAVQSHLTTEKLDTDDLISFDCGILSDYASDSGNPIYGFASNTRRSAGVQPVIGGQFSSYAGRLTTGNTFGAVIAAISEWQSNSSITGVLMQVAAKDPTSVKFKIGTNVQFLANTVAGGLGGDHYNTNSFGINLSGLGRGTAGEKNGWNVGINFGNQSLDLSVPPAWVSTETYLAGSVVTSGAQLWKAIVDNINVAPAAGATWVKRSATVVGGGYGIVNYAIGIDFTGLSVTQLGRMWSGIRFQSNLAFHWEEQGIMASFYDSVNSRLSLCSVYNAGYTNSIGVEPATGLIIFGKGYTALGGGGAATLGNIGGTGPATAGQNQWLKILDNANVPYWIPVWK